MRRPVTIWTYDPVWYRPLEPPVRNSHELRGESGCGLRVQGVVEIYKPARVASIPEIARRGEIRNRDASRGSFVRATVMTRSAYAALLLALVAIGLVGRPAAGFAQMSQSDIVV